MHHMDHTVGGIPFCITHFYDAALLVFTVESASGIAPCAFAWTIPGCGGGGGGGLGREQF